MSTEYRKGLMPWYMATPEVMDKVRAAYEMPADLDFVVLNVHGQAFELINGYPVGLTLIEVVDGFHNYRQKQ